MAKDSSPFHNTEFRPIEETYITEGVLFGLRQPDGKIMVNFDHNTKYSMLKQIAHILNCEIVQVHGTWEFTPTRETILEESQETEEEVLQDG